jgi:hypothetical protein
VGLVRFSTKSQKSDTAGLIRSIKRPFKVLSKKGRSMQTSFRLLAAGCLLLSLAVRAAAGSEAEVTVDEPAGPLLNGEVLPDVNSIESQPADEAAPSARSAARDDNQWRYRQYEGRWWYWLPSNRWVMWQDGRWVDPPAQSLPAETIETPQYSTAPRYVAPAPSPAARFLQPRPQSWYYSDRAYVGPQYYYDEFYEPYGGARPYPYYPVPRPYPGRGYSYGGYPYGYRGGYPYYGGSGVGVSIGGGGVRFGIGF